MPQLYNQAVMTEDGLGILTRAQAGEIKIEFTRIAVGDGVYADEEKKPDILQEAVGLKSARNSYPLSSVQAVSGNSVKLTVLITNQDPVTGQALVSEGYYLNEIGLYAKEKDGDGDTEVLYSIAVTAAENGDYMPPYNGHSPAQIVQEYYAAVSNGAEITIRIGAGAALTVDGDASNTTATFTEAAQRENLVSGDSIATLFAKIKKWYPDILPIQEVIYSNSTKEEALAKLNNPLTVFGSDRSKPYYMLFNDIVGDSLLGGGVSCVYGYEISGRNYGVQFILTYGVRGSKNILRIRSKYSGVWSELFPVYNGLSALAPAEIGAASVGELTGSWNKFTVGAVGWYRIAKREIGTSYPSPCTVSIKKVWNNGTSECHKFEIINLGESAVIKSIYDKTLHESYAQFTKVRLVNGTAEAYVDIYSSKSLSNNLTVTFSDSVSSGGHAWTLLPSAQIVPETAAGETVLASLELKADYWVANDLPLSLDKGGTGKTTVVDAANVLINGLSAGTDVPQDEDAFISQFAGGGKTNNDRFYRRPVSKLWDYIKSKLNPMVVPDTGWVKGNDGGTLKLRRTGGTIMIVETRQTEISLAFKRSDQTKVDSMIIINRPPEHILSKCFLSVIAEGMYCVDDSVFIKKTTFNGENAIELFASNEAVYVSAGGPNKYAKVGSFSICVPCIGEFPMECATNLGGTALNDYLI